MMHKPVLDPLYPIIALFMRVKGYRLWERILRVPFAIPLFIEAFSSIFYPSIGQEFPAIAFPSYFHLPLPISPYSTYLLKPQHHPTATSLTPLKPLLPIPIPTPQDDFQTIVTAFHVLSLIFDRLKDDRWVTGHLPSSRAWYFEWFIFLGGGCGGWHGVVGGCRRSVGGGGRLVFKKYRILRGFLFDRVGGMREALSFEDLAQRHPRREWWGQALLGGSCDDSGLRVVLSAFRREMNNGIF